MKTTEVQPLKTKPIIVMNAPPHSGKDFLTDYIIQSYLDVDHYEFKTPMYQMAAKLMGLSLYTFTRNYNTEGWKDTPNPLCNGKTVRELMIAISESMVKPFFGKDYFGDYAARQIKEVEEETHCQFTSVFSDGGFDSEVRVLARAFPGRVVVVRIHRDGTSFDGDSRSFLEDDELYFNSLDIENNGTAEEFTDELITKLGGLGFRQPFQHISEH